MTADKPARPRGFAAAWSFVFYVLAGLVAFFGIILSLAAIPLDDEGHIVFVRADDVSPLSKMWIRTSEDPSLVKASTPVIVPGENLSLAIPTALQSIGGRWRTRPDQLSLECDPPEQASLGLKVVEVFSSDWDESISTRSGLSPVIVSLRTTIPNSKELTGGKMRCVLKGSIEIPIFAGSDQILGGTVTTNMYFQNTTRGFESLAIEFYVFPQEVKQQWVRWGRITNALLFTILPGVLAVAFWRNGKAKVRWFDPILSTALLVPVVLTLLMSAFFQNRHMGVFIVLFFALVLAALTALMNLADIDAPSKT